MHVAVLIGRFQPFHHGHAGLLEKALAIAPKVLVVLGSSFHARSAKNPFTWQERAAMIQATLNDADRERVSFVPVRDYFDDARWAGAVQKALARASAPDATVSLIAYAKDASSYYLNHFPQWEMVPVSAAGDIDATNIRRLYFEAEDMAASLNVIAASVPPAVLQFLATWCTLPHYAPLAEEQRFIAKYKAAWARAPYAPIFVTVDAVVVCAGHILLIRRGGFPGKGQWAVPGGFVEQRERLLQSAMRELAEETQLGVPAATLEAALDAVRVFDHPGRSQRGRTITHAHYFKLNLATLPAAQAADDAAELRWVPVGELAGMEEAFYEDHFHMIDTFLGVLRDD